MNAAAAIALEVSPSDALADEAVCIRVRGLPPGRPVRVTAQVRDDLGRSFQAGAAFVADDGGTVDLSTMAPTSGSYQAVDAVGLLWSLAAPELGPPFIWRTVAPCPIALSAEIDGTSVASVTYQRRFVGAGVTRTEVTGGGLVGTLFEPPGPGPHPVVMVLLGSGGGLSEQRAALLASRGFAALALAYFSMPGLPAQLLEIPLEYFERAIAFLATRETLDAARLFVFGQSRGGELALLLGAELPAVKGVIGWVPSGVLFGGIGDDPGVFVRPAWTRGGVAPAYLPSVNPLPAPGAPPAAAPIVMTPLYDPLLADAAAVERATIAVERIAGPVLLVSCEADALWPSVALSELAMRRFEARDHTFAHTHLRCPNAGHLLGIPHTPTTTRAVFQPIAKIRIAFGGSPAADAAASVTAWNATLAFLQEHLPAGR